MLTIDRANRVRWWIAGSLAAVVVLSVTVSIAMIAATAQRSSVEAADDIVERIGERTADLVTGQLEDAVESLDSLTIVLDERSLEARDQRVERALAAQLRAVPQISGAFVGYPDGSFRFVRRVEDELVLKRIDTLPERHASDTILDDALRPRSTEQLVDDVYDPRTRPWYQLAAASDDHVWTDPYVFFSSGQPGVTAAVAVNGSDGRLAAVIGIDLAVARLNQFLDDLPIDSTAEAFIVAGDRVVAAPTQYEVATTAEDGTLALATVDELGIEIGELPAGADAEPRSTGSGGRIDTVPLANAELPAWSIVVRTGRIEFVDMVRRQSRLALLATGLSGLLLLAASALFANWLRRPIGELQERAMIDPLTQLPNRQTLLEEGDRAVEKAEREGSELTVAVLDIDEFKSVNDRHGHGAGDDALRRMADGLRRAAEPGDLVGRIGGDEFVLLLPGLDRAAAEARLVAIQREVQASLRATPQSSSGTVTIGATMRADRSVDLARLIAEADTELIVSKRTHKGRIAWHDELATTG